jgi:hypothetical protein
MATRVRRLALLAALAAAALILSGCHEILRATFGADRPVHSSPAASAAGRPFTGRADGELFGYKLRHGFVKTTLKAGYIGNYRSNLTGSPLANGKWHANFKAVRNRGTGKTVVTGLVLSTFTDTTAGRACLKLSWRAVRKNNSRRLRRSRSRLTVVGGEGAARTLYGTANARVRLGADGSARLRGRMTSRQGAERGLTRACRKLRTKFALTPLAD